MAAIINKLYVFNRSEDLVATLSYENPKALPFYSSQWKEQINGENKLTLSIPGDQIDSDLVAEAGYIGFFDFDNEFQLFEIRVNDEVHDFIKEKTITAEHVGISELMDEFIEFKSFSQTADSQLNEILQNTYGTGVGTRWEPGVIEVGLVDAERIDYELANCRMGIVKITDTFGGEVRYRLVTTGTEISNRFVDLLERRGSDTLKRIEFGKDLKNIQRTLDTYGLYTALYGYGKSMEVPGGKSRVKFTNVIWTTPGKPLNKPVGQHFIEDPVAKAQFGRDSGTRNRYGYVEFTEIDDPNILIQKTYETLMTVNKPKVTYQLTMADLERIDPENFSHEKIRLGDTVRVIDRAFNPPLEIETRIVEITRNLSNSEETGVVLDSIAELATDVNTSAAVTQNTVSQNIGIWQENPMMTNLMKDHSFELIPLGTAFDATNNIFNVNLNFPDTGSNYWWRFSGTTPKIYSILPKEKSSNTTSKLITPFGFQAAVVDSQSKPYQHIRLMRALSSIDFPEGRLGPYTFSAYMSTHLGGTGIDGIGRMEIWACDSSFVQFSMVGLSTLNMVDGDDNYQMKRIFCTVKELPTNTQILKIIFLPDPSTPTFSFLVDGVQAVPMNKAAPYDAENGVFQLAQGLPGTVPANPRYLQQSRFSATKNNQSVSTGFTRVIWNAKSEDALGEFHLESDSNASFRSRFVPIEDGTYYFNIAIFYTGSAVNNTLAGRILVNGTERNRFFHFVTSGTTGHQLVGNSMQILNAGDIVTLESTSGNVANTIDGTAAFTYWKGCRIG